MRSLLKQPNTHCAEINPSKPKIAYVLKRYPRFSETFIVNEILAHEIAEQPLEIFALRTVDESHFQDILGQVRSPVTRFPDKKPTSEGLWNLMHEAGPILPEVWTSLSHMKGEDSRDIVQALMIAMVCRKQGIVHLHAHFGTVSTSVARLAAQFASISYSFTAHAKDIFFEYEESQNIEKKLNDAARVVTVSDYNLAYLQTRYGSPAKCVHRIYNGLDLSRFRYCEPAFDANEILAVGRLVEKKGFHILIEAVRILKDKGRSVTCRIIGSGDEAENLQAQIIASDLAKNVRLVGPKPQSDVVLAMRKAAVLACPCIVSHDGNRDGLPTVLLEAMALGTPCVSTDVTGIPELVCNEVSGLCVPEADADALAVALVRMLDDNALRMKVSKSGRRRIEKDFDQIVNAAELRRVFADAIAQRTAPDRLPYVNNLSEVSA